MSALRILAISRRWRIVPVAGDYGSLLTVAQKLSFIWVMTVGVLSSSSVSRDKNHFEDSWHSQFAQT